MRNEWFEKYLCCPHCNGALVVNYSVRCESCGFTSISLVDLRLNATKEIPFKFVVENKKRIQPSDILQSIDTTRPLVTYNGPKAIRDSKELMSEISRRLPNGGNVLDLGCGPRDQFESLNFLNFNYVGVDYINPSADLLVDAHAIPFHDESFDCVFSYAVLEHLYAPHVAISEISRILKKGGYFVGTVSQGEPFHASYFHFTPWGLMALVRSAPGLNLVKIWSSGDTLSSLASMGRYSRLLKATLACLNILNIKAPWLSPRKIMWTNKEKQIDRLYRAGSICFVIEKTSS